MKKSQYHLVSYDEKQCAVTIISKGKMLSSGAAVGGHMYLALEAKNITGTGEDWMVFDFISNGGAEAQLTRNQGAFEEMKKLLRKVADDLSNPESLRKAALGLITLEFNITSSNKILTFLLTAAPESVFEIVRHIVKSSSGASTSFLGDIFGCKGIIRSSHSAHNDELYKIPLVEYCYDFTQKDRYFSWAVPKADAFVMLKRIREEECKPPPFKLAGKQAPLFGGSLNCMDWALEKVNLLPTCKDMVEKSWKNSGAITTPTSIMNSFNDTVKSEEKHLVLELR